jgi:orotidine-5'-phosphate decarboxylase
VPSGSASFAARLQARIARHSPLCIGIDPSAASLRECGLPDDAEGALAFGKRILVAADYALAIVKPQSAYFERHGSAGIRALEELTRLAQEKEVLVLLDAKRGDIDTTGLAYAEAYFSPRAALRADALTLHAYMGLAALESAIDYAVANDGGLFPVVRSSNPEGTALQKAKLPDGRSVAEAVCDDINNLNARHPGESMGPIGAVIGATCADADGAARRVPRSFILAPGVGVQGATMQDIAAQMPSARGRVLPSVSRAILRNGADEAAIGSAIRALREEALLLGS